MIENFQASLAEWGLFAAALASLAGAAAAFLYLPVVGRVAAVVLLALAAALGAYDLGYAARGSLDNSGAIQAQLNEANRQLAATQTIARLAAVREKTASGFSAQQQDKINAYEAKLRDGVATGGCGLSDDDVRSLSDIGTGFAPQPASAAGPVRKTGGGSGAGQR